MILLTYPFVCGQKYRSLLYLENSFFIWMAIRLSLVIPSWWSIMKVLFLLKLLPSKLDGKEISFFQEKEDFSESFAFQICFRSFCFELGTTSIFIQGRFVEPFQLLFLCKSTMTSLNWRLHLIQLMWRKQRNLMLLSSRGANSNEKKYQGIPLIQDFQRKRRFEV